MQNDYSQLSDDDSENGEVTNFKAITGEARKELEDNYSQSDEVPDINPAEAIEEIHALKKSKKAKRAKETAKHSWCTDAVEAMIKEWENRPLLFDCSHPQYHIKDKRRVAIDAIRRKLPDYDIDPVPTVDEIIKKMNSLRTQICMERNSFVGEKFRH